MKIKDIEQQLIAHDNARPKFDFVLDEEKDGSGRVFFRTGITVDAFLETDDTVDTSIQIWNELLGRDADVTKRFVSFDLVGFKKLIGFGIELLKDE